MHASTMTGGPRTPGGGRWFVGLGLLAVLVVPRVLVAAQEVIDRMLAVVAGQVITLSDVRGFLELGLVEVAPAGDRVGIALQRLIDRELILAEVERYPPREPSRAEVAARVEAIRRRFATDTAFTTALQVSGLTDERVHDIQRDDIRIERYLSQRFGAAAQPTDAEVARYYEEHPERFIRNGEPVPYADVHEAIRAGLQAEQRTALIESWVDGLRRRASVRVLYLPPSR